MLNGLYRVTTSYLCAGFVVEGGRVVMCAPVLRKRLPYWQTVAIPVHAHRPDATVATNTSSTPHIEVNPSRQSTGNVPTLVGKFIS